MSIVLLNKELIVELKTSRSIFIVTKHQKNIINYFFSPSIGIKLYDCKISWKDSKNISFVFNKYTNSGLFNLLKFINTILNELYNDNCFDTPKKVAPFIYEKEDSFYIRCFVNPKKVISKFENEEISAFHFPQTNATYKEATIVFKNIWEDKSRAGYNIELYSVKI